MDQRHTSRRTMYLLMAAFVVLGVPIVKGLVFGQTAEEALSGSSAPYLTWALFVLFVISAGVDRLVEAMRNAKD